MKLDPNDPRLTACMPGELDEAGGTGVEEELASSEVGRQTVEEVRELVELPGIVRLWTVQGLIVKRRGSTLGIGRGGRGMGPGIGGIGVFREGGMIWEKP